MIFLIEKNRKFTWKVRILHTADDYSFIYISFVLGDYCDLPQPRRKANNYAQDCIDFVALVFCQLTQVRHQRPPGRSEDRLPI